MVFGFHLEFTYFTFISIRNNNFRVYLGLIDYERPNIFLFHLKSNSQIVSNLENVMRMINYHVLVLYIIFLTKWIETKHHICRLCK